MHVACILLFLIVPLFRGCVKPPEKEIITFIDFGAAPPPVQLESVPDMSEPEPVAPEPAPEPEPSPIPEPVKKPKPKPKPKPVPKEAPKPKPKPKPKKPAWKPTSVNDIKVGKKVNTKPKKPAISSSDIKKALSDVAKTSSSSPSRSTRPSKRTGNPSETNAYLGRVMQFFDRYWVPPGGASSSQSAIVRIYIRKNGQITKRTKIKGSGDSVYDKTVMNAVNSVNTIPVPPAGYPYDYVEVEFRVDD